MAVFTEGEEGVTAELVKVRHPSDIVHTERVDDRAFKKAQGIGCAPCLAREHTEPLEGG